METKERIQEIIATISDIKNKKVHYTSLKVEREKVLIEKRKAEEKVEESLMAISKLDSITAKSIFSLISGKKAERLAIEKEELTRVSLELNALEQKLELLDFEIKVLEDKVDDQAQLEKELELLVGVRERQLLSDGDFQKDFQQLQEDIIAQEQIISKVEKLQITVKSYEKSLDALLKVLEDYRYGVQYVYHEYYDYLKEMKHNLCKDIRRCFSTCKEIFAKLKAEFLSLGVELEQDDLYLYKMGPYYITEATIEDNFKHVSAISNIKKYKNEVRDIEDLITKITIDAQKEIDMINLKINEAVMSS